MANNLDVSEAAVVRDAIDVYHGDPQLRELIRELARNWRCSEAEAVRRCLREADNG
jgi:hypothetical protein